VPGRIANAKIFGWVIYAAGFAVWLFGYFTAGQAPVFDWSAATPWWIASFVPNLEAELGMALMFASVIPIYGGAVWGNRARLSALRCPSSRRGRDLRVVGVFGVAGLALDLGTAACAHKRARIVH
jgi:hypothetical protein